MLGLLAGTETTASTIRAGVFCLLQSPRAYRKLKEEIHKVLARGNISSPISFKDAKEIDYLQVRLLYTLRAKTEPLTFGAGRHLGELPYSAAIHSWPL